MEYNLKLILLFYAVQEEEVYIELSWFGNFYVKNRFLK